MYQTEKFQCIARILALWQGTFSYQCSNINNTTRCSSFQFTLNCRLCTCSFTNFNEMHIFFFLYVKTVRGPGGQIYIHAVHPFFSPPPNDKKKETLHKKRAYLYHHNSENINYFTAHACSIPTASMSLKIKKKKAVSNPCLVKYYVLSRPLCCELVLDLLFCFKNALS